MHSLRADLSRIAIEITRLISNAAINYLRIATKDFYGFKSKDLYGQSIIGNMSISIELMIKAWLGTISLMYLFKDLPLELSAIIINSKLAPKSFRLKPYEVDLLSAKYKMPELDECISYFKIHFPKEYEVLSSHLKFLSQSRNRSVHSFLPETRLYEVERVVYLGLNIYLAFSKKGVFQYARYELTENDKAFMKQFDDKRIIKVQTAIKNATDRAKELKSQTIISVSGEGISTMRCPICQSDAVISGNQSEDYQDGVLFKCLDVDTFECDACGLKLDDFTELELAGIDTYHEY